MALPVYGPSHLISKEESVWRILKAEIFHSVDATYEKLALKTLETILKVLSAAEPPSPSLAMMKSNDIISAPCLEECFQYLQQPDTKLAKLAGFVFQAFISSNVTIANYLLPHIFPFLVTHINSFQQPSLKKTYIDALSEVLIGCKEHTPFPVTLRPMYQDIFKHFYDASQSFSLSLQLAGFKGIFHLLSIPGLLDFENQKMYITCLTDILMHSVEELREMSIESLSELSIHQPLLIQTWVLPELFSKLKSKETWNNNILNPLVALSKSQDLFPFILSSLVDLIGTAPEESLSSLLSTILLVLNSSKTILTASLKSTIHISTTRKFVDNTLYSICEVASEMTRKLSSISEEESIIRLVFDQNLLSNPFTFPISACVLANMHPSVPLPLTASQFLYQALETPGLPIRYTSKWIATLINKSNDPDELLIHPSLRSRLSHVDANTFHLSLWMTKALMMRSHDAGFSYCEELISYLSSDNLEVRFQVADKLGILVEESKTVLHADSHALVKPIYKQRIFEFCISKIAVLFYNSTSDQLGVLIIALRQLLNKITKEVLLASAKELAPLLLVGLGHLSCDDASLLSFIHTFEVIILEASDIASLHVQSLVQLLLNLLDPNTRKLQIRIAVLTCLSAITQLKYSVRHPLKHIVIRGLLASLDDPKRIVRQHAVNCRSLWYLSQSD
ncbi:mms19 nucleotide excision repair [Coelomomyces lativittatus]|nr:mms19 nucleotide excision repair [Coelomomyces lativittatus]